MMREQAGQLRLPHSEVPSSGARKRTRTFKITTYPVGTLYIHANSVNYAKTKCKKENPGVTIYRVEEVEPDEIR